MNPEMNHQEHQIILDNLVQQRDTVYRIMYDALLGQNQIIRYLLLLSLINFLMVGMMGYILYCLTVPRHVGSEQ